MMSLLLFADRHGNEGQQQMEDIHAREACSSRDIDFRVLDRLLAATLELGADRVEFTQAGTVREKHASAFVHLLRLTALASPLLAPNPLQTAVGGFSSPRMLSNSKPQRRHLSLDRR